MSYPSASTAFLLLPALLLSAACERKPAAENSSPAPPPEAYFEADPATAGSITGVVRWSGPRPPARRISMEAERECQLLHPNGARESIVEAAPGGELAGAVVYVKRGLEGKRFPPPGEAAMLEQKGCQFGPRVLSLRTGQTLAIRNSDPVSHNVHPMPKNNRDWNQQQPPGSPDLQRRFGFAEFVIPVKCNVHAWMRSYLAVAAHPFVTVTDASGSYSWTGLPPGRYTIAVWHEAGGESEREVTVAASARMPEDWTLRQR